MIPMQRKRMFQNSETFAVHEMMFLTPQPQIIYNEPNEKVRNFFCPHSHSVFYSSKNTGVEPLLHSSV